MVAAVITIILRPSTMGIMGYSLLCVGHAGFISSTVVTTVITILMVLIVIIIMIIMIIIIIMIMIGPFSGVQGLGLDGFGVLEFWGLGV